MPNHTGFIQELKIRYKFAPVFLDGGFIPFVPEFDTGVDLIIYREEIDLLIKIQFKSRWTIDRKYMKRNIGIAFPVGEGLYLVPHDEFVEHIENNTTYLTSRSWMDDGIYHGKRHSAKLLEYLKPFKLDEKGQNEAIYKRFVRQ
ncbi:hypothetical protein JNB88_19555 [Rhizobium cauense]|uniref:hypothetical protein n=1 Tax=Rhizobium cauense TaxID=1166683 RepID=UPI001C6F1778|nr:hypothetical protein [Rhizobium cauense]MBW9115834.1 hypothetical protein [Rhizobium cauense]